MIAPQRNLDRLARGPVENQLGLDRAGGKVSAQHDLERDEFVSSCVELDLAILGIPEMVGGQVALRLSGNQLAGRGIDLVQLVKDRDIGAGDSRQCGHAGGAGRRACLSWGSCAGPRFDRRIVARGFRAAVAGGVNGSHRECGFRPARDLQVMKVHLDSTAGRAGKRNQLAGKIGAVKRGEEAKRAGGAGIAGRDP